MHFMCFQRPYIGFSKQGMFFKNATQCGTRVLKLIVATWLWGKKCLLMTSQDLIWVILAPRKHLISLFVKNFLLLKSVTFSVKSIKTFGNSIQLLISKNDNRLDILSSIRKVYSIRIFAMKNKFLKAKRMLVVNTRTQFHFLSPLPLFLSLTFSLSFCFPLSLSLPLSVSHSLSFLSPVSLSLSSSLCFRTILRFNSIRICIRRDKIAVFESVDPWFALVA